MHDRYDKIAPGLPAKLNLFIDASVVLLALQWAAGGYLAMDVQLAVLAGVSILAWVFAATVLRLYSPCTPRARIDSIALHGVAAITVGLLAFLVHTFVLRPVPGAFDLPVFTAVLFAVTATINVALFVPYAERVGGGESILIAGSGPMGRATYDYVLRDKRALQHVVGFLRFDGEPETPMGLDAPFLGDARDVLRVLSAHSVSEVFIAGRVTSQGEQMQALVRACEQVGMPFALPVHPLSLERATLVSEAQEVDGYLHYQTNRPKPLQYAVKRLVDIALAAPALVALTPLLVLSAAVIKLTSAGPVFFRQVRVGLHGARFNLLKFRSMVMGADQLKEALAAQNEQTGPVFKIKNDPRVTRVGRLLRRYSIDELPQLINVLRGDMTLVGPRPALPNEVAQYLPWQRRRLSVRPGLTCYWQVGGRDNVKFDDWMRLDLQYVDNWSLSVDARLILQTVPVVLTGKGAS